MSLANLIYDPKDYFSDKTYKFNPTTDVTAWLKQFSPLVAQPESTSSDIFEFPPVTYDLGEIPETQKPGSTIDSKDYSKQIEELSKAQTKQQILQSALGLGTGVLGGLATMPFVKSLRKQDYELGLQAMREKEMSPSAVAARSASLQNQIIGERSSKAQYLQALSEARLRAAQAVASVIK